jgi:hypothetical protein
MPCNSLDGPTTALCGQVPVPVNRFRVQETLNTLQIQGIFGPSGLDLSKLINPLSSLENKLVVKLGIFGSTEWELVWNQKVTPSGRVIFRLAPSTRRMSEVDFTGWPTPCARDWRDLASWAFLSQRLRHQSSTVTTALLRNFTVGQIPFLLSALMGYPDLWIQLDSTEIPLSLDSLLCS